MYGYTYKFTNQLQMNIISYRNVDNREATARKRPKCRKRRRIRMMIMIN